MLCVKKADQLVYEKRVNYFFNEEEPNYIKLDDILAKKLKKILEDKDESKDQKVRRIQVLIPDNNEPLIKKELIKQARETFDANFFGKKISFPRAVYTFKNKEYSEFNEVAEKVHAEIKSLYALSKKNRKSFEEVRPTLESAMTFWINYLEKNKDPDFKKIVNNNISLVLVMLGDYENSKKYLMNITESEGLQGIEPFTGSFKYYLKGTKDAIKVKQRFKDRAKI